MISEKLLSSLSKINWFLASSWLGFLFELLFILLWEIWLELVQDLRKIEYLVVDKTYFFLSAISGFLTKFMSNFLCDFLGTLSVDLVLAGLIFQLLMKLLYFITEEVSLLFFCTKEPLSFDVEYDVFLFTLPIDFFDRVRFHFLLFDHFLISSWLEFNTLMFFLFFKIKFGFDMLLVVFNGDLLEKMNDAELFIGAALFTFMFVCFVDINELIIEEVCFLLTSFEFDAFTLFIWFMYFWYTGGPILEREPEWFPLLLFDNFSTLLFCGDWFEIDLSWGLNCSESIFLSNKKTSTVLSFLLNCLSCKSLMFLWFFLLKYFIFVVFCLFGSSFSSEFWLLISSILDFKWTGFCGLGIL